MINIRMGNDFNQSLNIDQLPAFVPLDGDVNSPCVNMKEKRCYPEIDSNQKNGRRPDCFWRATQSHAIAG